MALITVKSGVIFEEYSAVAGVFIACDAILLVAILDAFLDASFADAVEDFLLFSFQLTDSAKRFSKSATQPLPRFRPYSALSESPTTKIRTGGTFGLDGSAALLIAGAATM